MIYRLNCIIVIFIIFLLLYLCHKKHFVSTRLLTKNIICLFCFGAKFRLITLSNLLFEIRFLYKNVGIDISKVRILANKVWHILGIASLLGWSTEAGAGMAPANFGAMYNFAAQGKTHVLKNAIDRGMDIDSVNHNGFTGLCVAVYRQDYVAFKVFKSLGADVNHKCIKQIPQERRDAFINQATGSRSQSAGNYGGQGNSGSYRQDYGNYQQGRVSQGRYGHIDYSPDDDGFISADARDRMWTIAGVGLVAGGLAIAFSSSGGGDNENPEENILSGLHGVSGTPYVVPGSINKNVIEDASSAQNNYWAVYNPGNSNIVNKSAIQVSNVTPSAADNKDHWGGIFAENGYVYNTGDINITSGGQYGKGIMSCVVSVYNPDNTACVVNPANPVVGDIYNAGKISVIANQSMGIFSSTTNQITNTGKIEMTGNDNAGIWLWGKGNVHNSGSIVLTGAKSDYLGGSMNAIWVYEGGDVVNNGDISVTDSGNGGTGIYTKAGKITNNGKIAVTETGSGRNGIGIKIYDGEVVNNNSIEVSGTGSIGIKVDNSATVTNNSVINVKNGSMGINGGTGDVVNAQNAVIKATGDGSGIVSSGKITNEGTVDVGGTGLSGGEITNTANGTVTAGRIGIFGSTVTNDGQIKAGTTGLTASGTGVNNGTISAGGMGMYGGSSGSLENKGTIDSGLTTTAIAMVTESGSLTNEGSVNSHGGAMLSESGEIINKGNLFETAVFSMDEDDLNQLGALDGAAVLQANSGKITNEGSLISTLAGVRGYMITTTEGEGENVETTYHPANIEFTNSGTMEINDGQYAVFVADGHLEEAENADDRPEKELSSLVFNNTGKITVNDTKSGIANGIVAYNTATMTNEGEIFLSSESRNISSMYGMLADNVPEGSALENKGTIRIEAFDSFKKDDGTVDTSAVNEGNIIGMAIRRGKIVNDKDGKILISANNAYGMYAKFYVAPWEEPLKEDDNEIYAHAINNGLIRVDGENNIAMVADGEHSALTNKGTIEVKKPNVSDVYIVEGDEAYDAGSCSSFICLKNGATYINSGSTTSAYSMNFDNFGDGRIILGKGGSFEAPEISGDVTASSDIVTGSNADSYSAEKAFTGEDKGINVDSGSYLFNAYLKDNGDGSKDVVMERKNFHELTDKASVASFLEQNYTAGNNTDLYDTLKMTTSSSRFSALATQNLGLDFFPDFAKQNLDVLKSLNRSINDTVLANSDIKDERVTAGYSNFYRRQDGTSELAGYKDDVHSIYGVFDKKYDNQLRYGLGVSYSKYNSKYDGGNKREENIVQLFMPIIYQTDDFEFISTPRIGYGWGDYSRFAADGVFGADTDSYYYGLANELRHEIDLEMLVFEPIFEFNVLGLYQDKMKENQKLEIAGNNNLSVEAGVGLYAKKTFKFGEDELRLRAGGTVYHEFGDPYHRMSASMYGMNGSYNLNSYTVQRNRAVLSARAEYQHKQANVYGQFNKYIEDDGGYEMNAGLNWAF